MDDIFRTLRLDVITRGLVVGLHDVEVIVTLADALVCFPTESCNTKMCFKVLSVDVFESRRRCCR